MNNVFPSKGDKSIFNVPENYFENFQAELENRMNAELSESDTSKRIPLLYRLKPYVYAAAAFVAIFFSVQFIINMTGNKDVTTTSRLEFMEENNIEPITAEDILMSSLDEYSILYYYLNENE